jgi:nucleoside-diphosphate-sugar epimerase
MLRILVTGANGFIGMHVCRLLVESGYFVRAAVRKKERASGLSISQIAEVGEVDAHTKWEGALEGITTVIHLAARAHVLREHSRDPVMEFRNINVAGTESLARACVGVGIKRIVFMSSVGVNGERTDIKPFTEDDAPSPKTPYAISKWEAEKVLIEITRNNGLEYTIIRSPLVYGPRVPGNFFRLLNVIDKKIPLPFAKIDSMRSFIGLGNLVDVIKLCISHPNAANQSFLVSDGEDISTTELIVRLSEGLDKRPRLFHLPYKYVRGCLKLVGKADMADKLYSSLQVNTEKMRTVLGWQPSCTLNNGLQEMALWYKRTMA